MSRCVDISGLGCSVLFLSKRFFSPAGPRFLPFPSIFLFLSRPPASLAFLIRPAMDSPVKPHAAWIPAALERRNAAGVAERPQCRYCWLLAIMSSSHHTNLTMARKTPMPTSMLPAARAAMMRIVNRPAFATANRRTLTAHDIDAIRRSLTFPPGKLVFSGLRTSRGGYSRIYCKGKSYAAHRLAYFVEHGHVDQVGFPATTTSSTLTVSL